MLETQSPTLQMLFDQLGLDGADEAIEAFVDSHQLPEGMKLEDAGFWGEGQKQFFQEARAADAAWTTVVDDLDALLRRDAHAH